MCSYLAISECLHGIDGRARYARKKSSNRGRCCEGSDRFGSARSNDFRLFEQF